MRYALAMAVVALVFPGAASATTASSFDSASGKLSVGLTGTSATTSVGCSTLTQDVLVGGADPGTGSVSCSAVKAIGVTGDDGSDSISLAGVSATMFASLTSVTVNTGGGNDTYFGSAIGDTVNMGPSDATTANAPGDVVTPGSGNDHITCPGGCQVIENLTGTTTLTDTASSDPGGLGGVDSLSNVTSLKAETSGNNVNVDASGATVPIVFDGYGNSAGQVFRGGSANDSFNIRAGSASIDGGAGSNSLMISPGTDGKVTLTPTSLTASVNATLQNIQSASITGASGDNVYDWSTFTGPVVLSDTSGNDIVTAGAGNDSITLFGGQGSVAAGAGDDQIYLAGNPTANYSVDGGSGSNTLAWVETASGTITATDSTLTTPDGPITLSNIGALTLHGTNSNDIFDARGFSGPVTIEGEGGQDVMLGGSGADSFTGFSDSTDCFNGGPGADRIDGGGSTSDTNVGDPADTLVSGSTYTPVSTCGYGDASPSGSGSAGGGSGAPPSTPPAPAPPAPPGPPPSRISLNTTITSGPSGFTSAAPTFTFTSKAPKATFECRYDAGAWTACTTPLTTYGLKLGAHTFSVRSVSPAGARDPTPPSRSFTLGVATVHASCTIVIPWEYPPFSPECHPVALVCPAGARCTVSVHGTVSDADQDAGWNSTGIVSFSAAGKQLSGGEGGYCDSTSARWVGAFYRACPYTIAVTAEGPAEVVDLCNVGLDFANPPPRFRGPDDQRRMVCSGSYTIEPDTPLGVAAIGDGSISAVSPGPGLLALAAAGEAKGAHATTARAHRPTTAPAIAPSRLHVSRAGPVRIRLKLSRASKAALSHRRRLTLHLRLTFTPTRGKATMRTQTLTLISSACAVHVTPKRHPKAKPAGCP